MKTYGNGCIDPHFLDLGTSWRWVISFTPRTLYPRERAPGIHCIGGWVDPRAGLNYMENWKFLTLLRLELRPLCRPARSQSLYRLRYPGSLILTLTKSFFQWLFQPIRFRNHFSRTVGLLGLVISPSQSLYLNTRQHKQRINAYTHWTSMP
jgi:hypothetical protein